MVNRGLQDIVESMGGWWIATLYSIDTMGQSVYPAMSSERRLAGEPVYHGDEGEAGKHDAISNGDQPEWCKAGGRRIIAGNVLSSAEKIVPRYWPVVILALHDVQGERDKAAHYMAGNIAGRLGVNSGYVFSVCRRWGIMQFNRRHAGAVSVEYRLKYVESISDLQTILGYKKQKELETRSDIFSLLESSLSSAKKILENY